MKVYVIKDEMTETYSGLFEQQNDRAAVRAFKDYIGKSPSPSDFTLISLGSKESHLGQEESVLIQGKISEEMTLPEVKSPLKPVQG